MLGVEFAAMEVRPCQGATQAVVQSPTWAGYCAGATCLWLSLAFIFV